MFSFGTKSAETINASCAAKLAIVPSQAAKRSFAAPSGVRPLFTPPVFLTPPVFPFFLDPLTSLPFPLQGLPCPPRICFEQCYRLPSSPFPFPFSFPSGGSGGRTAAAGTGSVTPTAWRNFFASALYFITVL